LIDMKLLALLLMLSACAVYPQSDAVRGVARAELIPGAVRPSNIYELEHTIEAYDCLGGWSHQFKNLADYAVKTGKMVRWHGNVFSACTVMADRIRDKGGNQCLVSNRVNFGYHQARDNAGNYSSNISYRDDTKAWIKKQGGMKKGNNLLIMKGAELLKFYKMCNG